MLSIPETVAGSQVNSTAENHNGHADIEYSIGTNGHHAAPEVIAPNWSSPQESIVALAFRKPEIARAFNPNLDHDHEIIWRLLKATGDRAKMRARLVEISKGDSEDVFAANDALTWIDRLLKKDAADKIPPGTQDRELEAARELMAQIGEYHKPKDYPLTDTGNAERFIEQHGQNVLYCKALGWHLWDSRHWKLDESDHVFELGKQTVRSIYNEAARANDDQRPKVAAWAKASESLPRRNALIELAGKDGPKIEAHKFDTNPWLFNVQNGTLDLRTGILMRPDRAALITKSAPVFYNPKATCPRFIQFLAAVLNGDAETAIFLQRFLGYTLTGDTREQCFLILYGNGSNGKSTLLNVFRWLLGAYCKQTKPDTLMKKQFGDGIPNDVAMLRGARMVTAIETNEARQFDEAKIKEMTGGDPVSARFFRKEFFEYVPEFKLYLATNHKPQIIGDDAGIWRRVRLVPFNVQFWDADKGQTGAPHLQADKTLGDALREELPGILNWALQGCLDWQREGLPEPKTVSDATADYRCESDPIETFLGERCYRAATCEVANARLYDEFKKWAEREAENSLSQVAFTARMKMKGFTNSRGTGGTRKWKGIGLLSPGDDR